MKLPYITKDLPGIGGVIKKTPKHFIVEEIPLYEPCGEGNHLYVNITKENITTKKVQEKLANLFDTSIREVGLAGMKDKDAITTQTFSLPNKKDVKDIIEKNIPIIVNWTKLHGNKLRRGHLLGNKFTIIITDLNITKEEALERVEKINDILKDKGMPNFYGPQRFGIDGNNIQKGLDIIKCKKKMNNPWLRKFLISSYQSYLCNLYLIKRIELGLFDKIISGDVLKKYDTGGMFEVEDVIKEQKRYDNKEISFTAPIFGSKMWEAKNDAKKLEDDILKENNITIDEFKNLGIKGTRRIGRIFTDIKFEANDEGLILKFSLPKGSFATIILREFMKNL